MKNERKYMIKYIFIIIFTLNITSAQGAPDVDDFDAVLIGMTQDQVEQILGKGIEITNALKKGNITKKRFLKIKSIAEKFLPKYSIGYKVWIKEDEVMYVLFFNAGLKVTAKHRVFIM